MIKKNKNKYCVYSKKDNRNLGCYRNLKDAKRRLKQVEYFKNKKK